MTKTQDAPRPKFDWGTEPETPATRRKLAEILHDMKASGDSTIGLAKVIRRNPKPGEDAEYDILFRFGVTKGVTGVGMAFNPDDYNLITVFDMNKNGFRSINLDGILMLRVHGTKWKAVRE